jgi:hypothetical protein
MLDITQVHDKEYVLQHIDEAYELFKWLEEAIEIIKQEVKTSKQWIDLPTFEIKYSSYNKMVPINLETIMSRYPVSEYPECYNISLSAKAWDVIMEPELVEYKSVETVKFTSKN